MKYALAYAASELVNFRKAEFLSLCQLLDVPTTESATNEDAEKWVLPYVVVDIENDILATRLIERSMLIKSLYHIWCESLSIAELPSKISQIPTEVTENYLSRPNTFKVIVSSANRKISHEDQLKIVKDVVSAHSNITATVKLSDPDHQLNVLLDYAPRNWIKRPTSCEVKLRHVYYGRLIGVSKRKEHMNSYRLADRSYLGNTSMDVRLASIMSNVGLCNRGSIVWDPFIGTGSIVLAASVWGALGGGSDIDYALVHGMGKSPKAGQGKRINDECLRKNYLQYGLQSRYLDVVVADAATLHRLLRVPGPSDEQSDFTGIFDAILTDPPYGFRESSRRVSNQVMERKPSLVTPERLSEITGVPRNDLIKANGDAQSLIEVPHDLPHFPHKELYPLTETHSDLLELSNQLLKPGGRLVFWMPVNRPSFTGLQSLPVHRRLSVVSVCEQKLTSQNSRYMVAMRKLQSCEPDEQPEIDPRRFFQALLINYEE